MTDESPGILVTDRRIDRAELARLVALFFGSMVKLVVDVRRRVVAVGGELHADAEHVLLEHGSHPADLWGAHDYPGRGPATCLELTALINIRPARGNRSMEIEDLAIREAVRQITFELVGAGEDL